jgi:hypothetical protein
MDIDFTKLGSGPMIARQLWVANVEMAISVAEVAQGNFCSQAALRLLHTPLATTLLCHPFTWPLPTTLPTPQARYTDPIQHQPKIITPGYAAHCTRLSRSLYFSSHTNRNTTTPTNQMSLYPRLTRQPCTEKNRTQRQVFLTSTPTTKPQPYDKICAHINCLHTQMKALMITGSSVT